jgi:hypothetical protein
MIETATVLSVTVESALVGNVYNTAEAMIITDAEASVSQQFKELWTSKLTKCCEQKEKRADHDPLVLWKEDPHSPYDHSIINTPLEWQGTF